MSEMQQSGVLSAILQEQAKGVDVSSHPARIQGATFTAHSDFALVFRRNGIERLLLLTICSTFETKYRAGEIAHNLQLKVQDEIHEYWDALDTETQRSRIIS